jgi:hypothetical protein
MPVRAAIAVALSLAMPAALFQATPPPAPAPAAGVEGQQDLVARLTPAEKQQFDDAGNAYRAGQNAEALALYKQLLKDFPGDAFLSKLASEPALNLGENGFVVDSLKPVTQANPDDWQAAALLTRAYAQSGEKAARDAGIAHMLDLHKRGLTPPRLNQYLVERVATDNGSVMIFTSLEPYSTYKVHNFGRVLDPSGKLILMITVESSDFDQPPFAQTHPKEAAAGIREFSLDAYRDTGTGSNGKPTQTHYTFKFFVGQPDYETVRQNFLDIAAGKIKPISSRDNIPTQ